MPFFTHVRRGVSAAVEWMGRWLLEPVCYSVTIRATSRSGFDFESCERVAARAMQLFNDEVSCRGRGIAIEQHLFTVRVDHRSFEQRRGNEQRERDEEYCATFSGEFLGRAEHELSFSALEQLCAAIGHFVETELPMIDRVAVTLHTPEVYRPLTFCSERTAGPPHKEVVAVEAR